MAANESHHDNPAFEPDAGVETSSATPAPRRGSVRTQRIHSFISNNFRYLLEARAGGEEGTDDGDESDEEGGQAVDDSIFDDISLGGATPRGSAGAAGLAVRGPPAGLDLTRHVPRSPPGKQHEQYQQQQQQVLDPEGRLASVLRALVLGGACMTLLVGYKGSVSVEGFLLGDAPLDDWARRVHLLSAVIASLLVAAVVIRVLGCKWTFVVGTVLFAPYSVVQYWLQYYTVLPAAVLSGLGWALTWCARNIYLCQLAQAHASYTHNNICTSLVKCFSAFYVVYNLGEFWDSLITTMAIPPTRTTWFPCCDNCSDALHENTVEGGVNVLNGVYISLVLVAFFMSAVGLSSLQWSDKTLRSLEDGSDMRAGLFFATITGLRHCRLLALLLPLILFFGVHKVYFIDEYIQNYVSCELGLDYVVNSMMCLGATSSVAALITAGLASHTDGVPIAAACVLTNMATLVTLLVWQPQQSDGFVVYVLAALGGTSTGVLNVHLNAMCGALMPGHEVVAYSHLVTWHTFSQLLATSVSSYLHLTAKLYVMVVLLAAGGVSYIVAELSRSKA